MNRTSTSRVQVPSRVTKYDPTSIWEIGRQWDIDRNIDMECGISIWVKAYRYGHPGYRYGIQANDVGDVRVGMVLLMILETDV
jgi:hypothetical protein